ncbi:MAG: TolC family protein [Chitinophagales bacterium]|nr:TolC family protein [Chitinophagales bacterium]MDW8419223.1 TolC family protein [Chitinophagales bacterium]
MRKNEHLLWLGLCRRAWLIVALNIFYIRPQAQILTLEDALAAALRNNYDILLAKNEAEIAAQQHSPGNAGMLPRVQANVSNNFSLTALNQRLANGNEINRPGVTGNNLQAGVSLQWTLFDGLRMFAANDRLKHEKEASLLQIKDAVQQTVADVIRVYYDIVRAEQLLRATEKAIALADERMRLAELRQKTGIGSKAELLQARMDRNENLSALLEQKQSIAQRKADLNRLLARDADAEFTVTDTIPLLREPLTQIAETNNIQIKIADERVAIAQAMRREAFAQFFPVLNGAVGYQFNRNINSAGFFLVNQNNGITAGVSLQIPLFNGLNTLRQYKVATLALQSAQFMAARARFEAIQTQRRAVSDYTAAIGRMQLEEESMMLAEEYLALAGERYRAGQSTILELREAELHYTRARSRMVQARYAAKVAETELLLLRGELVR